MVVTAASHGRDVELMFWNTPPTNTLPPDSASAFTTSSACGAHELTLKFDRMRARFARGWLPTESNAPPMYQPPAPSEIAANTLPWMRGNPVAAAPVVRSSGTPPPVTGWTRLNEPPM